MSLRFVAGAGVALCAGACAPALGIDDINGTLPAAITAQANSARAQFKSLFMNPTLLQPANENQAAQTLSQL